MTSLETEAKYYLCPICWKVVKESPCPNCGNEKDMIPLVKDYTGHYFSIKGKEL
jgi:hypothetical protein